MNSIESLETVVAIIPILKAAVPAKKGGIQVELYQTKGTIHGYDVAVNSEIVKQSVERRVEALKIAFHLIDQ